MSVWDSIVGQDKTVALLKEVAAKGHDAIAQSWLICGPPGSGRSNVALSFAAALENPDQGLSAEPSKATREIMSGTHPDVRVLATDKVTIGIKEVRELVGVSEQMPSTLPWRIIIIQDVDRMLERTTNVLLKEIEEPSEHTIWLLCAPSPQDVLPTIRSRTRVINLAVPPTNAIVTLLVDSYHVERGLAMRAARLSEGHIGVARLYATHSQVLADRDKLVIGVLNLHRASDAVLLAANLVEEASAQANDKVNAQVVSKQSEFRRINALGPEDRIPPNLRSIFNAIGKKDDVKRKATRLTRDVLDRALNSIASVYRDVSILQNNAEDAVGLVNLENRKAIADLSVRLDCQDTVCRLDDIAQARRRLIGNGNLSLVFEALFCSLIVD